METRNALKKVTHFAEWEFNQKRPSSVKVLRLKSKSVLTLGVLPNFQMRTLGPIIYLVVSDHGETLRIYFFNRNGDTLGGQNYKSTPKFMKKLQKSTTVKYQLPKKEREKIEDPTVVYQKEFTKIHQAIGRRLGISHRYPYILLVNMALQFKPNRTLGCERIKKELHVPLNLKEKNYFELLAILEWFYTYLSSTILTIEEMKNINVLYDIAILLSAAYNPKNLKKILDLKYSTNEIQINNNKFNLTGKINSSISSLSKAESKDELILLLKRYLGILQVLKKYKIFLTEIEFVQLFLHSCEIFNTSNDSYIFYTSEKEDLTNYFFFRIFSRAHEMAKRLNTEALEYKTYFLSTIFGLTILEPIEIDKTHYTLEELIENIISLMNNPIIRTQIHGIDTLVSDIISNYIISQLLCQIQYAIKITTLDIKLEIQNPTNYALRDFTYELTWKPKKKIHITASKDIIKSQDLHEKVKRNYLCLIHNKGSITFSCTLSFTNPLFNGKTIEKTILLKKIVIN